MKMREEKNQYFKEAKEIIVREKGKPFWEEFVKGIEQSQRENFIDGYKYAIRILEDALGKDE